MSKDPTERSGRLYVKELVIEPSEEMALECEKMPGRMSNAGALVTEQRCWN
jgi:hypothetical protein